MLHRAFWTERRFTGMTLLLGAVLFLVGAFLPLTDAKGTTIYYLPPEEQLLVIFAHSTLWQWTNILFISAAIVTILGLALLATQLRDAEDRSFSSLGLLVFVLSAVLGISGRTYSLSLNLWAAQELASTGAIPVPYVPLRGWTQALGYVDTILFLTGLLAYGGALLTTRVLPRWVGWLVIVYVLAGSGFFAYTHDFPPLFHYFPLGVVSMRLLLPRYEVPGKPWRGWCRRQPWPGSGSTS